MPQHWSRILSGDLVSPKYLPDSAFPFVCYNKNPVSYRELRRCANLPDLFLSVRDTTLNHANSEMQTNIKHRGWNNRKSKIITRAFRHRRRSQILYFLRSNRWCFFTIWAVIYWYILHALICTRHYYMPSASTDLFVPLKIFDYRRLCSQICMHTWPMIFLVVIQTASKSEKSFMPWLSFEVVLIYAVLRRRA